MPVVLAPGELSHARAFVAGEIDVDSDLTGGLRRAGKTADAGRRGGAADIGPRLADSGVENAEVRSQDYREFGETRRRIPLSV